MLKYKVKTNKQNLLTEILYPKENLSKLHEFVKIVLLFYAYGIPAYQLGIKPALPALKGKVLTTRLPGKWVNWMVFETYLNKTMFLKSNSHDNQILL